MTIKFSGPFSRLMHAIDEYNKLADAVAAQSVQHMATECYCKDEISLETYLDILRSLSPCYAVAGAILASVCKATGKPLIK